MNVLLFPRILAKTGVGNHVKQLSDELCRQGHSVTVVSSTKDIQLNDDVVFIQLPADSMNPFHILKVIRTLHTIIEEKQIDIVHCHHRKASLIMHMYNMFYRIPFVYSSHSANIPSGFLYRKLTFVGDCVIAVSKEVQQSLKKNLRIPEEKIVTIPNGIIPIYPLTDEAVAEQKTAWGIPSDSYVLAMHSRIDPVKNHLLMVEAVSQLKEESKRKVTVVCSGETEGAYYEELRNRIHELKLDDRFVFVGWTKPENILGIADFLFLPSKNEGFALSVAEAFMMGVPVARTHTAGFEEQQYCLLIDAKDPQPIVKIIEALIQYGKEPYKERIEKQRILAFQEFTLETMTKRTVAVYKAVTQRYKEKP